MVLVDKKVQKHFLHIILLVLYEVRATILISVKFTVLQLNVKDIKLRKNRYSNILETQVFDLITPPQYEFINIIST